jgi:rare lipoprotein A
MPTRSSPHRSIAAATLASLLFAACAPQPAPPTERGRISHYGHEFAGRKTASGVAFDPDALTMAHRTLPFGTRVRVTNVNTGRSVTVRINDRGPFVRGRVIDVSHSAAESLGMVGQGVAKVKLDVVE